MYREGAAGALLDIYEQVITALQKNIEHIADDRLTVVIDPETRDENCRSLQAILTHVVHAGFGYATYVHNLGGHNAVRPFKAFHVTIREYSSDIAKVLAYTEEVFNKIKDDDLEQKDNSLKLTTGWGQIYDIEQMMEHAIVHILRHNRQINKLKDRGLV